jgi:hypothetical protein
MLIALENENIISFEKEASGLRLLSRVYHTLKVIPIESGIPPTILDSNRARSHRSHALLSNCFNAGINDFFSNRSFGKLLDWLTSQDSNRSGS